MSVGRTPYLVCLATMLSACASESAAWVKPSDPPLASDRVRTTDMAIGLALKECLREGEHTPSDVAAYLEDGEWQVGWDFWRNQPLTEALVSAATGAMDGRCTVTLLVG